MTDPRIPVTEDELHAYVDNELPAGASRRCRGMARGASRRCRAGTDRGARWRRRCMRVTTPSPTSRCRSGSRSSGWCGSRANGSTARLPRRWWRSSPAAAPAGWRTAWPLRRRSFQNFTVDALDAHRLYVVEVRHPVEVPGSERAHLQQWLTKRCGWDVRAPELGATGLKLVGGRLLPGPDRAGVISDV